MDALLLFYLFTYIQFGNISTGNITNSKVGILIQFFDCFLPEVEN